MLVTSFRPVRPAPAALCSSAYVHACVPAKLVLHAAFAPGSPSIALKLKRPGVDARAPLTVPALGGVVVVVVADGPVVVVVEDAPVVVVVAPHTSFRC